MGTERGWWAEVRRGELRQDMLSSGGYICESVGNGAERGCQLRRNIEQWVFLTKMWLVFKGLTVSKEQRVISSLKCCEVGVSHIFVLHSFVIQMKKFSHFHWNTGVSGISLGFKGRSRNICSQLNCRGSFRCAMCSYID